MLVVFPMIILAIISIRLSNFIVTRNKINTLYKEYIEYSNNYYSPDTNCNLYFDNFLHKRIIVILAAIKKLGSPPILNKIEEKADKILWEIAYYNAIDKELDRDVLLEYLEFIKNVNLK